MRGLLLKDLYLIRKYLVSYLVLMVVFLVIAAFSNGNMFLTFYPCLIATMVPVNLLSYDERSGWDRYSSTLPLTRAQIVSAKYGIGLGMQAMVLIFTGVAQAIRVSSGAATWREFLLMMEMMVTLSFFSSSFSMPFMFKMGVEKGRMAYLVSVGLVTGGSMLASGMFQAQVESRRLLLGGQMVFMLLAMVCYIVSWLLSIRFYKKREL